MNILVTVNKNYLPQLCVMLHSLTLTDQESFFDVYVMNRALAKEDFDGMEKALRCPRLKFIDVKLDPSALSEAPVTDRYPLEMYYRIFAAGYLPETIDRVLYLDPDLVVLRPLKELYGTELGDNYFAAASHVGKILQNINELRLRPGEEGPYINSGVMLMNLDLLRREQNVEEVYRYIEENKKALMLPDQDVISGLYPERILPLDPFVYNMTERLLLFPTKLGRRVDIGWVCEYSSIIHYCGRNKPWKQGYIGKLDVFYHQYAVSLRRLDSGMDAQ